MRSLTLPAQQDEQMDAADLDSATYGAILTDLASVNRWTLAARPTLGFLKRALGDRQSFNLLDVGYGDGDMLRAIARWARKNGIKAALTGIDLNPKSEAVARSATASDANIRYLTGDYHGIVGEGFDIIVSSLVAHHMTHDELVAFLRSMEAHARVGWLVSDPHRHRLPYMGFPILARLMGWHRIVREDGQLSIARAFRPDEWPPLLAEAGIGPEAQVMRRFPFRICVERPALIAGGGPAGAAAAILLAHGGAMPVIIERSREAHDVVCGGFVGPDAIAMLRRLRVDPAQLGARPISRVRLIAGTRTFETDLPFRAVGLSRRTLDAALLAQAAGAGAAVERGITIRHADPDDYCLHLSDETVLGGEALFLATGKHDVRGLPRPATALGDDPALGLRIGLEPTPALSAALGGVVELHLLRDGYAGLLLLEDGRINLCLSVAQSRLTEAGGQPDRLIDALSREAPLLADRVASAGSRDAWSSVARVPYGWRQREGKANIYRLGDQGAVIPSLVGDGIAIALSSAVHAVNDYFRDGPEASGNWQRDFHRRTARPIRTAAALKWMGETPALAGLAMFLLRLSPAMVRWAASTTRIGG